MSLNGEISDPTTSEAQPHAMCCETLSRPALNELLYVHRSTFVRPHLRATSTAKISATRVSPSIEVTTAAATVAFTSTVADTLTTTRIYSTIVKQEHSDAALVVPTASQMISQRTFENLVITNTIVAAFCIVLMVTLTGFLIFLLIPSIRRRWLNGKSKDETKLDDFASLSGQQSFHHFTLGPSRLNPLFEQSAGTLAPQFGTLFHPHTTAATLLHPTFWAPMSPTPVVSSPVPSHQTPVSSSPPMSPTHRVKAPSSSNTAAAAAAAPQNQQAATTASARPPLPSHPPTTIQRSPRKR